MFIIRSSAVFHQIHSFTRILMVLLTAAVLLSACEPAAETNVQQSSAADPSILTGRNDVDAFPQAAQKRAGILFDAVKAEPKSGEKNGVFAMFAHSHNLPDIALYYYARAAQRSSDAVEWPYLRGVLLQDQGQVATAIESFRKASGVDPDYPPLRLKLAQALAHEGQQDETEKLLKALVHEHPNYPEARWTFGQFKLDQGDYKGAVDELNIAVAQVPHYGSAHYALAKAYQGLGEQDKATLQLELFEKYRNAGPASQDQLLSRVYDLRGTSQQLMMKAVRLSAASKFPQAINVLLKLLENEPGNAAAHINLIGLYGELGQMENAEKHYKLGREIAPKNVKLHNNFGVLMIKKRDYNKAVDAFEQAIAVDSDYATPYKYLGLSLQNLGKVDQAQQNFAQAVAKDPLDFQAGYLLGNSLFQARQYDKAIEVLQKITVSKDPKTPHYLRALAKAYQATDEHEKAVTTLTHAREIAQSFAQTKTVNELDAELAQLKSEGSVTP